jgi:hypothetical protein
MFDDVDLWVDRNGIVNYQAPNLVKRTPVTFTYGTDVESVHLTHAVQFSKNIQVEVRSYTKRTKISSTTRTKTLSGGGITTTTSTKKVTSSPIFGTTSTVSNSINSAGQVTATVTSTSGGSASSGVTGFASDSGKERYTYFLKNATTQQCDNFARKAWRQISMMEFAIQLDVPARTQTASLLDVTSLITLAGMPFIKANGQYWPRRIRETLSIEDGWKFSLDCVNHTPPSGGV